MTRLLHICAWAVVAFALFGLPIVAAVAFSAIAAAQGFKP